MNKNIAVVWGGYSSEMVVSAKSKIGICSFLDQEKYNVYSVKIDRQNWTVETSSDTFPIDKNDFSFITSTTGVKVKFDFAYITIHGTPGEDGRLQGYFDMIGIPYSTCGMMTSALTFNKYICNKFLKNFGIRSAESYFLRKGQKYIAEEIVGKLGLPLFVKPNTGGSSFATTKVKSTDQLPEAINTAFDEADEVIIEQFIQGTEVTCGCYKIKDQIIILPITEVVTKNEFFDYKAKYEGEVQEITPARLDTQLTSEIEKLTSTIYELIGAKGIIRVDYIIAQDKKPWLLEVNTTPGMTKTSFIPQQVEVAGLKMSQVLTDIIENELNNRK